MVGIGALIGFVGGIGKDVVNYVIESKKQTKQLEIEKQEERKQKELDLQILEKQIELHKAGVEIEVQKRIVAEAQANADVIKSNNTLESDVIDIRRAEINAPSLEYLRNENGSLGMNNFWMTFCNVTMVIFNCFKSAPTLVLIVLIGFLIFVLCLKSGVSTLAGNEFAMELLILLEAMISYFTGRKISSTLPLQKKNS